MKAKKNTNEPEFTRRGFTKTVGIGIGAAATAGAASQPTFADEDDDDDDDAGLGDFIYTAATAPASLASSLFGSDDDDDDLDAEEDLEDSISESEQRNMWSWASEKYRTNQQYHGAQAELLEGVQSAAYDEAQVAFVDAATDGLSESECLDAALDEMYEFVTPIQKEFLGAWNDTLQDTINWVETIEEILGSIPNWLSHRTDGDELSDGSIIRNDEEIDFIELANGDTYETEYLNTKDTFHPLADEPNEGRTHAQFVVNPNFSDTVSDVDDTFIDYGEYEQVTEYNNGQFSVVMDPFVWSARWYEIEDIIDELEDEIETFVSEAYESWQAGEIDTDDLLTTAAMRDRIADYESTPMAVADLISLGASVDLERSLTIETDFGDGITWQLEGLVTPLNTPDEPLQTGETYDPDGDFGTTYMNHIPADAVGMWDEYEAGIDGGELTFTAPPPEAEYVVETSYDEVAIINYDEFEEIEEGEEYLIDLSDDLEEPIAEVEEIAVYWSQSTEWQQIQIPNEFEVVEITNQETDEIEDSAEFEQPWTPEVDTDNRLDEDYLEERSDAAEEVAENLEERFDEWEEALEEEQESGIGLLSNPFSGHLSTTRNLIATAVGIGVATILAASYLQNNGGGGSTTVVTSGNDSE